MEKKNLSKARIALILAALMSSLLLSALDSTIVGTAMKTIINELQGMEYYAWPFTIYMLCSTVIIPISGGIADIFGRKPIFLIGIATFVAGSILCGMSQNMIQLILYRGIQGLGSGILTTSIFTIVADLFPPDTRGKYMGIVTSVFGLSSIIGPLLGGLITDYLNWRWIFYINVPVGIIAVLLVVFFMPNFKSDGVRKKVDYPGTLFIVLSLVPMLLAFSLAGTNFSWGSFQIIGLLAFSAAMLVIFVIVESRSLNPMIPMTFFKERSIWITLIVAFLSNAMMYAAIIYIPYFIQGVLGSSATTSGAVTIPMTIGLMITSNIVGIFTADKSKLFRRLTILSFIAAGVGVTLLSTMNASTSSFMIIIFMVILGAGIGPTMPISNINVQNAAPIEQLSSATGTVQFFRTIGSTIGSAIFGTIMMTSINAGFLSLDLANVPVSIQESLKNPQIITNAEAVGQIISQTPPENLSLVTDAINQAKGVLSGGIRNVFLFCILIAAAGIIASVFFKGAPMRIFHKGEKIQEE